MLASIDDNNDGMEQTDTVNEELLTCDKSYPDTWILEVA